jgi:hypothetical protein
MSAQFPLIAQFQSASDLEGSGFVAGRARMGQAINFGSIAVDHSRNAARPIIWSHLWFGVSSGHEQPFPIFQRFARDNVRQHRRVMPIDQIPEEWQRLVKGAGKIGACALDLPRLVLARGVGEKVKAELAGEWAGFLARGASGRRHLTRQPLESILDAKFARPCKQQIDQQSDSGACNRQRGNRCSPSRLWRVCHGFCYSHPRSAKALRSTPGGAYHSPDR